MINTKDVQKFIKFARGTGKTFTIREQAIKEYKNGKRCAIITNYPDVYIAHDKQFRKIVNLKDIKSDSETIDIWGLSTALELIKNNNSIDRFKELPEFSKYDFVYVDADCYEQIIWQLLDNIEGIGKMKITKEEIEAFKKDCMVRGLTLPENCTDEWCIKQIKELYKEIENNSNTEKEDCKTEEMNCLQEREILFEGSNFTVFKDGFIHGEPNLRSALYEVALRYYKANETIKEIETNKKIEKIEPEGVEVCVFDDNNKEPLRTLMYHIRCPKCGETCSTDGLPYLNCSCGFNAKIIYSDDTKIIKLQDTINCLNVRINYMLATGEPKEKVLPFIAELKELVDALEFGTTYTELQTQKWRENPLGLKGSIMYSLR